MFSFRSVSVLAPALIAAVSAISATQLETRADNGTQPPAPLVVLPSEYWYVLSH